MFVADGVADPAVVGLDRVGPQVDRELRLDPQQVAPLQRPVVGELLALEQRVDQRGRACRGRGPARNRRDLRGLGQRADDVEVDAAEEDRVGAGVRRLDPALLELGQDAARRGRSPGRTRSPARTGARSRAPRRPPPTRPRAGGAGGEGGACSITSSAQTPRQGLRRVGGGLHSPSILAQNPARGEKPSRAHARRPATGRIRVQRLVSRAGGRPPRSGPLLPSTPASCRGFAGGLVLTLIRNNGQDAPYAGGWRSPWARRTV